VWTLDGELVATLRGHTDWVKCCAFSPDGKKFVSGSKDRTCIVWDAETLEQLFKLSDARQKNQVGSHRMRSQHVAERLEWA
jgi:WD40 repeat protein